MMRKESTDLMISHRVNELCDDMSRYIDEYNGHPPFNEEQLRYHQQTIEMRDQCGSVGAALEDDDFLRNLWNTLRSWGCNSRGARLQPLLEFRWRLRDCKSRIAQLEGLDVKASNLQADRIAQELHDIIYEVRLSQTESQVVTGSKALHHILPSLVPPIDRNYTRRFFHFWMQQFQYDPDIFAYIWTRFAEIAERTSPGRFVGKAPWATSESKVLDNAVIGYCRYHKLPSLS